MLVGEVVARGFWLCPAISLVLGTAVFILLGLGWWSAVTAAALLGCVVAAASAVMADRSSRRIVKRVKGAVLRGGRNDG